MFEISWLYISTSDHGKGPHGKAKVHVADDLQKNQKSDRAVFLPNWAEHNQPAKVPATSGARWWSWFLSITCIAVDFLSHVAWKVVGIQPLT